MTKTYWCPSCGTEIVAIEDIEECCVCGDAVYEWDNATPQQYLPKTTQTKKEIMEKTHSPDKLFATIGCICEKCPCQCACACRNCKCCTPQG